MFRNRWLIALAAIAIALVPVIADAHARAGGGCCSGRDLFRWHGGLSILGLLLQVMLAVIVARLILPGGSGASGGASGGST